MADTKTPILSIKSVITAFIALVLLLTSGKMSEAQDEYMVNIVSNKEEILVIVKNLLTNTSETFVPNTTGEPGRYNHLIWITIPGKDKEPIPYSLLLVDQQGSKEVRTTPQQFTLNNDPLKNSGFDKNDMIGGLLNINFPWKKPTLFEQVLNLLQNNPYVLIIGASVMVMALILLIIFFFFRPSAKKQKKKSNPSVSELPVVHGVSQLQKFKNGGMAHLYTGKLQDSSKSIVVKILKKERMKEYSDVMLFLEEAKTLIQLQSRQQKNVPGVVFCHTLGMCTEPANTPYIILEYLNDYLDLNDLLRLRKQLPERDALIIIRECSKVLSWIHKPVSNQKILHRDISPGNIMVKIVKEKYLNGNNLFGIKLIDFGVVFNANDQSAGEKSEIRGKPKYMPPELLLGKYNERSELYSLGIVMYELLSGKVPFDEKNYFDTLSLHQSAPIPLNNLPEATSNQTKTLLRSLLAKEPNDRPQTASDLYNKLDTIIS